MTLTLISRQIMVPSLCEIIHALVAWPRGMSLYLHRGTVQHDCVAKCSRTRAFSHLSLCVLFITTITLAVNNDDESNWQWSCDVLVFVKYGWFFLVLITFFTDDSLQSADKDQQEGRAVAGKPHVW